MKKLLICLVLLAGAIAARPSSSAWGQAAVPPAMVYMMFCATCHGQQGAGDGPQAATLSARPRDFTDCKVMSQISDDIVFKAIKFGGAAVNLNAAMPAWGVTMPDEEIKSLQAYVRAFCKK